MKKTIKKPLISIALLIVAFFVTVILTGGMNELITTGQSSFDNIDDKQDVNGADINSSPVNDQTDEFSFDGMPIYGDWIIYTVEDGLPSNKVNTVKIDDNRILVGTDHGLAVLEDGKWRVYTQEDGLAHRNVLSIDVNQSNGDVWIGTMNGMNRWSAGVFERFDQFNSGLANDVVYEVKADTRYTWIATAAGASRFDTYTGQWMIFNEETAPLHEPWTYGITTGGNKAYIAAWGGGVVEYNNDTGEFRVYRDPDGHFQISLFPDDGLVHDITTGVAYDDDILWVSTYFGLSRYNGQRWWGYFEHSSGLTSDFINSIKAKYSVGYMATDKGLSTFDGTTWVTYYTIDGSDHGETTITRDDDIIKEITDTSISHGYIWNMDIREDVIWVATSRGLSTARVIGYVEDSVL